MVPFSEDRYEAIELIVKVREDGESWFDAISDLISQDCQGSETEPCTCGLESMGGSSGTLDQCYKHIGIDDDKVTVNKADVLLLLKQAAIVGHGYVLAGLSEAIVRLSNECTWWEDFLANIPEDEEDDSKGEG